MSGKISADMQKDKTVLHRRIVYIYILYTVVHSSITSVASISHG